MDLTRLSCASQPWLTMAAHADTQPWLFMSLCSQLLAYYLSGRLRNHVPKEAPAYTAFPLFPSHVWVVPPPLFLTYVPFYSHSSPNGSFLFLYWTDAVLSVSLTVALALPSLH